MVVDDEKHAIEVLESFIGKVPMLKLVFSTTKPLEAFQYVQQHQVDLIFLDVHMPELEGIDFLKLLNGKAKAILTTAYPEYALEGYELDIADYLLKPILFERFLKAVQKVSMQLTPPEKNSSLDKSPSLESEYIFVRTESRGKLSRVNINDILYIEALGNYIGIFTKKTKILTLLTMKEIEEELQRVNLFIRIHKSYIVNSLMISTVDGNRVFVDQKELPIGDKYKERILRMLSNRIVGGKK